MIIMQLPGELNEPWPVVEIGDGCSFIVRNTGGFRIEDQVHKGVVATGKVTVNRRKFKPLILVSFREFFPVLGSKGWAPLRYFISKILKFSSL